MIRFWNQHKEFQDTSSDDVRMWDNFADHSEHGLICFKDLCLWVIVGVLATLVVAIGGSCL